MKKRTMARAGLAACALSTMALFGTACTDEGTTNNAMDMALDTADMAVNPSGDMVSNNPDIAGSAAPIKVTGFMQPASAVWDAATSSWYVSNIVTNNVSDPKGFKDNNAFISKVPANLMNPNHGFFTGTAATKLSAPFGMRIVNGKLYTGDVDRIWSIDLAAPMGANTIQSGTVAGGGLASIAGFPAFLIDVALDASGNIYVADATGGRLMKWTAPFTAGSMPTAIIGPDQLAGPSGVYVDGTKVVVAEAGVMQLAKNGGITTCGLDGSNKVRLYNSTKNQIAFQGIEKDANVYLIGSPGDKLVYGLLETGGTPTIVRNVALDGATTATDIGWDPATRTLAVPDTGANVVYFYKL